MRARNTRNVRGWVVGMGVVAVAGVLLSSGRAASSDAKGGFARTTIDLGVVVGDVDKSAKFYTDALGFTEVSGFDVSAEMSRDSGLADGHAFHVRVFVLGKGPTATRIKLMEFPKAPGKKVDNRFVHSSLGFSYLTIFVTDTQAALERLDKAGIKPVKPKPYPLGGGNKYLTLVKDPDGNIVELVEAGK